MNVTSIAVTGASGLVGQRLLPVLADDASVTRVVGLHMRPPRRRARGLEFHLVDVARAELKPLLEGIDVLIHLASVVDPVPDESLMARVNVDGTRRVLDAAAAVGVRRVVRVSSASVYGAWANNPMPLTEASPLRPNPGFSPAVQAAEVERLLAEWRDDHPGVVVTTAGVRRSAAASLLKIASILATSSVVRIGLVTKSSAPASRALVALASSLRAVTIRIGTRVSRSRIRRQASSPDPSGSCQSMRMASGLISSAAAMPDATSCRTTGSKPSALKIS